MTTATTIRFIVRTPREVVYDVVAEAVRVPTPTGHVGIRPRTEPLALAVDPGLVLVRTKRQVIFVGSAGGLLSADGTEVTLFTPLAVAGTDPTTIQAVVDRTLAEPGSEMAIRAKLGKLEGRILTELRARPAQERAIAAGERR